MPRTISPAESTRRMTWSGGERGDVWESPRWRDNYVAFTTSHLTKTQVHRSEEWRTRVHMIRASTDLRIPHQSMKQSQCIQSPRVEDFVYHLHDCRIFTKLDLRQDYHQLAVDTSTRQVVTFSTPWGNYRPERLTRCLQWSQVHEQSTETYPTAWTKEMTYSWEEEMRLSTEKYWRPCYNEPETTGSHSTGRNASSGWSKSSFLHTS